MGNMTYTMSKIMYDTLRYPLVWDRTKKELVKKHKPLSKKEVIEYVNHTFCLLGTVVDINVI